MCRGRGGENPEGDGVDRVGGVDILLTFWRGGG
jgi:hypothetical protein